MFDNVYGCRHLINDGIMRATDVMIGAKRALVCGYGDVGKGCAFALRGSGARVFISDCDPLCALQACVEGFQVVAIESVVSEIDIFVSPTGNFNKMKNNEIVDRIGFFDNEIDLAGLEGLKGMKVDNVKPHVGRFVFPDVYGVFVLASGRLLSHPSCVVSCFFTHQVIARVDLLKNCRETKAYKNDVYLLPKELLDEKVAKLHLPVFGAELTVLSQERGDCFNGSLHMTIQTGVLIETLQALGATVRRATQDHAAAGFAKACTVTVFAWKGETLFVCAPNRCSSCRVLMGATNWSTTAVRRPF